MFAMRISCIELPEMLQKHYNNQCKIDKQTSLQSLCQRTTVETSDSLPSDSFFDTFYLLCMSAERTT